MKAVILAGGKGTRLAPYTSVFPKPLVPLGHQPILEVIIRQLRYYGITDITLAVGYLGELIKAYFSNGERRVSGIRLRYVREDKPLGTAGALGLVPGLRGTFLVMNGDVLTALDYRKLVAFHARKGAALTIAAREREVQTEMGIMEVGQGDWLIGYREKPVLRYLVSMGVYVFESRVLKHIVPNTYLDFPDLVNCLLRHKEPVACYRCDDLWLDIGRHDDYAQAWQVFQSRKKKFLPQGRRRKAHRTGA